MVVKVAFLVGILYLMGLIKGRRETPSEDEEIWEMGADSNDPEYHGGEKPDVEIPKLEPPMLDPPNIELPILEQADAGNVANDAAAQHLLTEAEVHDLDVALGVHEDVLQLEVAIHHAHTVQVLQTGGHLRQVKHANVPPESLFTLDLENVEEIVALHVLHEEEEVAPGLEVALVPDQEGVTGGGQDPPLVDAVLHVPHILHELLLQGFHGHHVPAV